jgi:hypothetical protein
VARRGPRRYAAGPLFPFSLSEVMHGNSETVGRRRQVPGLFRRAETRSRSRATRSAPPRPIATTPRRCRRRWITRTPSRSPSSAICTAARGGTRVAVFEDQFTPTSDGLESRHSIPLGACAIFNLHVSVVGVIAYPGDCYARLEIVRGDGAQRVTGELLAGYVGSYGGRSWPGSPLEAPTAGPGRIRAVVGTVSAPGLPTFLEIPESTRWRLQTVHVIITTSAAPGNRSLFLELFQGGNLLWFGAANGLIGPSLSQHFQWGSGMGANVDPAGASGMGAFPAGMYFDGGPTFAIVAGVFLFNEQPGDVLGNLEASVEEWRNPVTTFT